MAKKIYDGEFVSAQPHELKYISSLFKDVEGNNLTELSVYYIQNVMQNNFHKVPRVLMYRALGALGYKKVK